MFNRQKPQLSPELEQRIYALADQLGVKVNIRSVGRSHPAWVQAGFPPVPDGGYSPSLRELELAIPPGSPEAAIETVALHELGHAATLRYDEARSRQKALENAYGLHSDETRADEIAAWEWAAPRISLGAIPLAAELAPVALRSYDVTSYEQERIRRLLWSGAARAGAAASRPPA